MLPWRIANDVFRRAGSALQEIMRSNIVMPHLARVFGCVAPVYVSTCLSFPLRTRHSAVIIGSFVMLGNFVGWVPTPPKIKLRTEACSIKDALLNACGFTRGIVHCKVCL